jgi:hypothetical protein
MTPEEDVPAQEPPPAQESPAEETPEPEPRVAHELEGRWARLPNDRIVRIVAVADEMVLAEGVGGLAVDRPVANVRARWTLLADDCLAVRAVVEPDVVAELVASAPLDLVVSAIHDLGGVAETAAIKRLLETVVGRWAGSGDAFKAWWRKVQPRLGDDPRIDDSRSLDRLYRLLAPGETKPAVVRPRLSDTWRLGRRLADAPSLKAARERARDRKTPLADEEQEDLAAEAALANLDDLDPTDRFMAAELGTWIETGNSASAAELLGEDLLALDLQRVPQKASRMSALNLLTSWLDSHAEEWSLQLPAAPVTLATAVLVGIDWSAFIEPVARRLGVARSAVVERAIAWGYPGSEESEPWKLPGDYEPYLKRIEQFMALIGGGVEPSVLAGIERGALTALHGLASSPKHTTATANAVAQVASLATRARLHLEAGSRALPELIADLEPGRLSALLSPEHVATGPWVAIYADAIELALSRDPWAYRSLLTHLASRTEEDAGAIALRVARKSAAGSRVAQIARLGAETSQDEFFRSQCVALAVTTDPDDVGVQQLLERTADRVEESILTGALDPAPLRVFPAANWARIRSNLGERVTRAELDRDAAVEEARILGEQADVLRAAAEQARGSLASSRTSTQTEARTSAGRLAANLLKPVAVVLAESFEAPSLEALQDGLAAILDRARIEPILVPDEVQSFDSRRHQWVGEEPYPALLVQAVSPGFIAKLEGEDAVVLVKARVVAAPTN